MNMSDAVILQLEKNGRIYTLIVQHGAPFEDSYIACDEFAAHLRDAHAKAIEMQKSKEAPTDVVPEIVDLT